MKVHSIDRQFGAFTLVELLAVIAVMVLLITISVRALGGGQRGMQLSGAGSVVVDMVNNARQTARAEGTKTMLVLEYTASDAPADGRPVGRALTLLTYSRATDSWQHTAPWHTFPDGIGVDIDSLLSPEADVGALFATPSEAVDVRKGGQSVGVLAATFLPNGRLENGGGVPLSARVVRTHGEAANYYEILVNESVGTTLVRRP